MFLVVRFNGFVVWFGLVQVSKIVNSLVWILSNRTELFPIVNDNIIFNYVEGAFRCPATVGLLLLATTQLLNVNTCKVDICILRTTIKENANMHRFITWLVVKAIREVMVQNLVILSLI